MPDGAARLFAAAAAVVAAHAVADAFVAPEQGTAWSDRLVPGIATLAVLAAAVVAFALLPAGGRAVLALVLGALAIEGGVLAVLDAQNVGVRGDDWTGFLLLPAGAGLGVLGVVLLWSSRKPAGHRYLRRAGLGLVAVAGAYWVVMPLGLAIGATHRPRQDVSSVAVQAQRYERVTVRTADGLDLAGWYARSRNGAALVSYPTRRGKLPQAAMLARRGYGVLLLDARGYDGSDGAPNAFGWGATKDVDAAVAWLGRQPDVRDGRIGGIGFSVGGEVMIEAAAGNPALRAVFSEGAGVRSVREALLFGARGALALPSYAVQTAAVAALSGTPPPPGLDELVARIAPRPVFLIHAEHGAGGEELNEDYYRAAGEPRELWRVTGAGHVGAYDADPAEYERRVVGFLDRALLGRTGGGGGVEDLATLRAPASLPLRRCFAGGASGLCGTLAVPENRGVANGRTIRLRVMVLRATGSALRPDPVFYLAGGPGEAATDAAATMRVVHAELNEKRDVVLVDQRGTGASNALACPEPAAELKTPAQVAKYVRECTSALAGDAAQYGTAAAMDDVEAVRVALGYGRINLYGGSYGATAAQVFVNRHPASVRTVVLDSGTLLDVPIFERLASNGQRALELVARRCAADRRCARAFPRWRADLPKLLARLAAKPVTEDVAGTPIRLTEAAVAGLLQALTLNIDDAAQIPFVVARAVRRDYQPLARIALRPSATGAPPTAVMPYSVMCNEPWAVRSPPRVAADAKGTYLAAAVRDWAVRQQVACAAFPRREERAADWAAPRSDAPLLALVGEADPQDPLANIAGIRAGMPNSRIVVVPAQGHGVGQRGCVPRLIAQFVERGSVAGLDASCARKVELPSWRLE